MVFDIYASILHPAGAGSFHVVVSAFPIDAERPLFDRPYGTKADAPTLSQAEALRRDLAASVALAVKSGGHEPGRVVFR